MSLRPLPPLVARVAGLLGGAMGERPPEATPPDRSAADDDALVALLIQWRLAAEVAATAPPGANLSRTAMRSLAIERERVRVAADVRAITTRVVGQALEERGIRGMFLKGEAVTRLTHGDASRRPMADLDILVAPGELSEAVAALVGQGLLRTRHDTPLHAVLFHETRGHARPTAVEVHCDVIEPPHPLALDLPTILARSTPATDTGLRLPQLADALMLSCVHLAFHENDANKTLLTLRDVALLSRAPSAEPPVPAIDADLRAVVDQVLDRAHAWAGAARGAGSAPRMPRTLTRRLALAAALRELDAGIVDPAGARWRVLGRRLGHALWWPTAMARGRALGGLLVRSGPASASRALAAIRR